MKKLVKILLIFSLITIVGLNFNVYADNNTTTENAPKANVASNETNTTEENKKNTTSTSSTQVTSISSVDENVLTTTDIINIILIAVCIVLILLGIAILIRLR